MSTGWCLDGAHSNPGNRIYRRPLGATEHSFYWDAAFDGTADLLRSFPVEVVKPELVSAVFGQHNVERAWLRLKADYPLLGANIEESPESDRVEFVVDEQALQKLHADEIVHHALDPGAEVSAYLDAIITGPRQLSNELQAKLWILSRPDRLGFFYIVVHVSHMIADGMAMATIVRNFLHILCTKLETAQSALEDRLHMVRALEDLYPPSQLSNARLRWRKAIAQVVFDIRQAKQQGGHGLPKTPTDLKPARSRYYQIAFTVEESVQIMVKCRLAKITINQALRVFAQLAQSRVLHKLRHQGQISDEDWDYRSKQPMHYGGPLNLRPFLDPAWYNQGGSIECLVCISFYYNTLPYMPNSNLEPEHWDEDVPPFSSLLSKERFLLRCRMVHKQTAGLLKYPLFLEISQLRMPARIGWLRKVAFAWRESQRVGRETIVLDRSQADPAHRGGKGLEWSCGGGSLGNFNLAYPSEYPLPPSHPLARRSNSSSKIEHDSNASEMKTSISSPEPILRLSIGESRLRCRPSELYLGAQTYHDQLLLFVYWDQNVYEEEMVKNWVENVRQAAYWYLLDDG